jgi:hypothetical protein
MLWGGIPEDPCWARAGHAAGANPLILVTAGDHLWPPKSLFSLNSSGVRDVGVAGANPVTPTSESTTWLSKLGSTRANPSYGFHFCGIQAIYALIARTNPGSGRIPWTRHPRQRTSRGDLRLRHRVGLRLTVSSRPLLMIHYRCRRFERDHS